MKIDLYTKAVLTVIALCLVWLCVRDGVTTPVQAQAAQTAQVVKIVEPVPVIIQGVEVRDPVTKRVENAVPVYDKNNPGFRQYK